MDLINIVEKFLREDAECRKRQLKIRSYFVVPLNEECGIIEWVPNVAPIRALLASTYRTRGIEIKINIIKEQLHQRDRPIEDSIAAFKTVRKEIREIKLH